MKAYLKSGLSALLGVSTLMPLAAFAQQAQLPPVVVASPGQAIVVLCSIAGWIFVFLVVIAIIYVLYAAFNYMTAGGDPEKVKTASNMLIYAAVAIAVGLLARGLPLFVGGILGSQAFSGCP